MARLGKHYCMYCHELLEVIEKSKMVNYKSKEAKDFNFNWFGVGNYMIGNIKFTWDEYYCPKCNENFSIREISIYERKNPPKISRSKNKK